MNALAAFYRSTVGKKVIMAVTGLIGIGFVIAHMVGNLQAFQSAEKINAYSAFLHGPAAELLWVMRAVLIAAVILHVLMAWQLTRRAQAARPVSYVRRVPQVSTLASRTMRWGGVLLVVFIPLHILHFTTRTIRPAATAAAAPIYSEIVASFGLWWVVLFYVIATVALGLHLYHGAWSSMRTIGAAQPSPNPLHRRVALAVAVIVWAGFTVVPLAVLAGLIR